MFHKHTSGLQSNAMKNDLALAVHISVSLQGGGPVSWLKRGLASHHVDEQQPFINLLRLLALALNPS